ncbi:origin recognition complex subunit 4 C-terminus-domain-containing protein [Mycena rebaudengoi]|nr:origin recognition complex subunit 4 C-terminus-domain-containing protein [Mycena rebaudengoi]
MTHPLATNALALKQLSDLLEGTVARGEGNSCLLLGPRGSGKTRIVEQCISNLPTRSIVLRLCGWSQQTDRLALREIAYQLHQQTGSAFLLPDELDETDEEAKSIPRQAKSRSLLDARSFNQPPCPYLHLSLVSITPRCRATPGKGIVVIGMTTRIDTINLLEKRVKSRFSGRMLRTAAPSQVHDWLKLTRGILTRVTGGAKWGVAVQSFLDDETTKSILNETFSVTRDVRVLSRLLTSVALTLSPSSPFPTAAKLASAAAIQRTRPRFSILHTLPYPSMCLLVACIHADTAGHPKVRQQIKVSNSAPIQVNGGSIGMLKCARPVLMSAFEGLVSARIIVAAAAPSTSIAKEFAKFRVVVGKEDVKRALTDVNLKKWLLKAT